MARFVCALLCAYGLLAASTALACDDHHGKCKIEDWIARYNAAMGLSFIDGVTTCDKGRATIRFYDGDKFIGMARERIEGHAFDAIEKLPPYKDLKIKYSIEPR